MTSPLASVGRFFGRDVRRALVATPLRRFLVWAGWIASFGVAVIFNSSAPWWAWLLVAALEFAAVLWIGDRLADHDALRADEADA